MKNSKATRLLVAISAFLICCCMSLQASAQQNGSDAIQAMQKVIDQQRQKLDEQSQELNVQSQQLKAQQQRLDQQQQMLDSMQSQLQELASQKTAESAEPDKRVADEVEIEPSKETGSSHASVSTHVSTQPTEPVNSHFLALDAHPLDVREDTGIFIYSSDQTKMFRIYGSVRALATYDNRQNFHPYDLNIPQVPVGDADVKDWNSNWTINTTKLGFQVGLQDYGTAVGEFDWKGENGDALRIRHLYVRNKHWVVGKNWTALNTLNFLPLSIDSHSTSTHLGVRPVQVKYVGGDGTWNYQAAIDYYQPKFDEPEPLDASARNILPNLLGNLSYVRPWGMVRVAAMLSANKVRYTYEDEDLPRRTSSDAGLALLAGVRWNLDENNLIKAHIQRTAGNSQYGADYGFGNYDMVFNPNTGEFQNLKAWGGQIALEHKWTPSLTTAIGGGYMSLDSKPWQPGEFFDHGYKALVNLFYRPGGWLKGLTVAGEVEFAGQTTLDGSSGDTTRVSVAVYYDF